MMTENKYKKDKKLHNCENKVHNFILDRQSFAYVRWS